MYVFLFYCGMIVASPCLSCEKKRYVTTQTTALLSVVGGQKIEDSQETCMNLLYIFIKAFNDAKVSFRVSDCARSILMSTWRNSRQRQLKWQGFWPLLKSLLEFYYSVLALSIDMSLEALLVTCILEFGLEYG